MNRRAFVSRVTLGGVAAACTGFGKPVQARQHPARSNVRFLGMMTFVERADRSFLVATPASTRMHHMTHVPFLMARAGSADREGVRHDARERRHPRRVRHAA